MQNNLAKICLPTKIIQIFWPNALQYFVQNFGRIWTATNRFGRTKPCERDKAKPFYVKYVTKLWRFQGTANISHRLQHLDDYRKLISSTIMSHYCSLRQFVLNWGICLVSKNRRSNKHFWLYVLPTLLAAFHNSTNYHFFFWQIIVCLFLCSSLRLSIKGANSILGQIVTDN